jgi:hypothetical protein
VKQVYALLKDADGSISIPMVIMMFVFVGFLAFVIDLAHLQTVKNELQNAADACALRGARAFLPDSMPINEVYNEEPNPDNARDQAHNTIQVNRSDNVTFQLGDLDPGEIQVGIWDYVNRSLLAWQWPPDQSLWGKYIGPGVSLPTRRNGSVSLGPVAMTLAKLFGINTVNVSATATAALSGVGKLEEGTPGNFPIAVDGDKVHAAGDIIYFSPDISDVGGWSSLTLTPASTEVFRGLIDGTRTLDEDVEEGSTISLQNGVACAAVKWAIEYYNATEDPVKNGVYYPPDPPEISFPVVEVDKFNQTATVIGFMAAKITQFRDSNAPTEQIPGTDPPQYMGKCTLVLQAVEGSRSDLPGGGRWFGLLSTQPKLVK